MKTIHIHEVLDAIYHAEIPFTPQTLVKYISETYGEDVNFGSCAGFGFPKEDVVEFLLAKNKILIQNGSIIFNTMTEQCNH